MTMTKLSTILFSETRVSPGGTLYWMSPELLDSSRTSSDGRPTRESDCYALGMVIYEVNKLHLSLRSLIDQSQVLTGLHPFYHLPGYSGLLVVARGGRPGKPVDARSLGFSDKLWDLVQLCWSELSCVGVSSVRLGPPRSGCLTTSPMLPLPGSPLQYIPPPGLPTPASPTQIHCLLGSLGLSLTNELCCFYFYFCVLVQYFSSLPFHSSVRVSNV